LLWFSFHPVHVMYLSLEYLPDSRNFNGFVRMHIDDFILDCNCGIKQEDLTTGQKNSEEVLKKYLNEKLVIKVNNEIITGEVSHIQISKTDIDINLLYQNSRKPETIVVKCAIMTDLYEDQANMVLVKVNDFEEGVKLTSELTEQTFKVN